jgi:D-serine deaminase-like pyridoxal phosphate-dependent protein
LIYTVRQLIASGVTNLKCSTTLELSTACEAGAADVLLAFPVVGANAKRVLEIASMNPRTQVSVLVENEEQAARWEGADIGIFIDINPGMDRTGIQQSRIDEIVVLARRVDRQLRGVHYYDGHVTSNEEAQRGYSKLMEAVDAIENAGIGVREVITSGTPAMPFALGFEPFRAANFVHRVSPGTVVYNDTTSLQQMSPEFGYQPAVVVVSRVVSHPTPDRLTCDAGHKSVSADAGVPTCGVLGRPDLKPLKPSEEHLPIEAHEHKPAIGEMLYLIPRHVCPTVNNFDEALLVEDGRIVGIERVTARGHERPTPAAAMVEARS